MSNYHIISLSQALSQVEIILGCVDTNTYKFKSKGPQK